MGACRVTTRSTGSADITESLLRQHLEIIAADSMEGRDTGRRGGMRAANYIAAELRRVGARPAGDNGTFFQRIPWITRRPDTTGFLRVGATETLVWRRDYVVLPRLGFALALGGQPFGAGFSGTSTLTVYGGRVGDTTIAPAQASGRVVVFAAPRGVQTPAFWQRDNLRRYGDAAAILVANLDVAAPPAAWIAPRETYWDSTATGGAKPMAVIAVRDAALRQIFGKSADSLTLGAAGAPLTGRVGFVDAPTEAPAVNVVAVIPGTDPALRGSYIGVTMHYDHVGMGQPVEHDSLRAFNSVVRKRGADDPPPRAVTDSQWMAIRRIIDSARTTRAPRIDSIFNGADDDGSGTAIGLAIARSMSQSRPRRSILFVFHTAEEKGLFGSLYYSDHPTVPRDSIVALVNMDQMGRGDPIDEPPGGPNALVMIGTRRRSTAVGDLVEQVNGREPYRFTLDYQFDKVGDPTNAYCRSDHYMYARYGIPVAFFAAAAWYTDYHMVSDETQYIAFPRMTRIANLIRDYVAELANLTSRPALDTPAPDPNGVCRQ